MSKRMRTATATVTLLMLGWIVSGAALLILPAAFVWLCMYVWSDDRTIVEAWRDPNTEHGIEPSTDHLTETAAHRAVEHHVGHAHRDTEYVVHRRGPWLWVAEPTRIEHETRARALLDRCASRFMAGVFPRSRMQCQHQHEHRGMHTHVCYIDSMRFEYRW